MALVLGGLSFATATARANGRYPIAGQIAVSPSTSGLMAVRATFGILLSRNGGADWDWICEPAVGYTDVSEDPEIGWTASSAIVGMFEGLAVSSDEGCSWTTQLPGPITDVVVRRDDTHSAFALTASYASTDDAGDLLYASGVYATHNDGAQWTGFGVALDPLVVPTAIDVSADGVSVYVSGYTFLPGNGRQGILLRSTDGGMHYTESSIALGPLEAAPYVSAVDPDNPLRVYVRVSALQDTTAVSPDRLLVTDDGAQTFRTVLTSAGPLLGFALSPDGSKVYVGGPDDGVQLASSTSLAFVKQSSLPVYCLASTGTALLACSDEQVAFLVGTSADDGATFSALLHQQCVRGALDCPASDSTASTAQCGPQFGGLAALQVGTGGALCGGAADGAADSSPAEGSASADATVLQEAQPRQAPSTASCDCRAGRASYGASGPESLYGAGATLGGIVLLACRRRSARRAPITRSCADGRHVRGGRRPVRPHARGRPRRSTP